MKTVIAQINQAIIEPSWEPLTSDEFDSIDHKIRFELNGGKGVANLAEYVEQFCQLANNAAVAKNGGTVKLTGNLAWENRNEAA